MGKNCVFLYCLHISATLAAEESASMLQRLGETKRLWDLFSQDTHFSQIQWLFFSLFHPALRCGFLQFLAVSLALFFSLFRFFGVVCQEILEMRTMFLLLLSCSWLITHGDDALASRRQLLQKCSSATSSGRTSSFSSCASSPTTRTRGSVGIKPCLAIVLAHVCLAIFGAWLQLNVDSGFRCIFEHSSACGNMVSFSPLPLSSSLSLPRIWLSRSTSKIDALDDDETPLRLTASQTATTRGVMASDIMGACDIAPSLHFVEPGLKLNGGEWIKVMDEYIVPNCTVLVEPGRKFLLILDNGRRTPAGLLV